MAYVRDRCCRRPPRRPCRPIRDRAAGGPRRRGRRRCAATGQPAEVLDRAVARLAAVDRALQGVAGVLALAGHADLDAAISARLDGLDATVARLEAGIETLTTASPSTTSPSTVWRSSTPRWSRHATSCGPFATTGSAPREPSPTSPAATPRPSALAGFTAVQVALSALDRLEVRGRDSAGLHLLVWDHGLDLESDVVARLLAGRDDDALFASGGGPGGRREPGLRLQGRGRDRRAGRQHRGAARRHARRRAAPPRARVAVGPRDGARPHPLGERRHHLRAQRPPGQPRGGGRIGRARTWRRC